jgi:hypothetical protein
MHETKQLDDTLIYFGDKVKALGEGRVGGYLVRYGSPVKTDLVGEYFAADTDFDREPGESVAVYYRHGLDPTLKNRKIGRATMKMDDVGVWVEAQLELRDAYEKKIYEMAEGGKLGWSSGSAPHLVDYETTGKARKIKSWPIIDASLTPDPCEPQNEAVTLKSLAAETETGEPDETPRLTLEERSDRLTAFAREFTDDLSELKDLRAKEGRTLSAVNRERLAGHMTTLQTVCTDMATLLEAAAPVKEEEKPEEPDLMPVLDAELLRFEETLSRLNAVPA